MSTDPSPRRMALIGALLPVALASLLYIAMMAMIFGSGPHGGCGDCSLADQIGELPRGFVTLLLWIVLAALLIGVVKGQMNRGSGLLSDFELNQPTCLLLNDGGAVANPAAGANIDLLKQRLPACSQAVTDPV